jgi:hypothetical protein
MSADNPFMSLKSDKERKYRRVWEQVNTLATQFDRMVTKVLTQLQEALFPHGKIIRVAPLEPQNAIRAQPPLAPKFTWCLQYTDRPDYIPRTTKFAEILLVKDTENSLPYFLCAVHDQPVSSKKCGLSESELVGTLMELLKSSDKKV